MNTGISMEDVQSVVNRIKEQIELMERKIEILLLRLDHMNTVTRQHVDKGQPDPRPLMAGYQPKALGVQQTPVFPPTQTHLSLIHI